MVQPKWTWQGTVQRDGGLHAGQIGGQVAGVGKSSGSSLFISQSAGPQGSGGPAAGAGAGAAAVAAGALAAAWAAVPARAKARTVTRARGDRSFRIMSGSPFRRCMHCRMSQDLPHRVDLDVLVFLPEQGLPLVSLSGIYEWAAARGYPADAEHVVIADVPVQFLPAHGELADEAIETAATLEYEGVPVRVMEAREAQEASPVVATNVLSWWPQRGGQWERLESRL
jgi:hypothetical protein